MLQLSGDDPATACQLVAHGPYLSARVKRGIIHRLLDFLLYLVQFLVKPFSLLQELFLGDVFYICLTVRMERCTVFIDRLLYDYFSVLVTFLIHVILIVVDITQRLLGRWRVYFDGKFRFSSLSLSQFVDLALKRERDAVFPRHFIALAVDPLVVFEAFDDNFYVLNVAEFFIHLTMLHWRHRLVCLNIIIGMLFFLFNCLTALALICALWCLKVLLPSVPFDIWFNYEHALTLLSEGDISGIMIGTDLLFGNHFCSRRLHCFNR